MWRIVKENPRAALYAVLVHLALLGLLVINVDWSSMTKVAPQHANTPVQARVVEEDLLQQELQRQRQLEEQKRAAEAERQRKLEEEAAAARRQREQEEKRLADLKRQQAEEAQRLEAAKRSAEQEVQRREATEAKRKAEEAERQKAATEAKRKAEEAARQKAAAEAKRKAEEEARRQAEAEAKRKAEAEARRQAEEAARQAELAAERARMEQERQRAVAAAVNQYTAHIQDKVRRNWRLPANWRGLSCTVRVSLIPGGDVVNVRIVRSSGDPVFDRSVESAVFQAAPLPVPSEPHLFDAFREFQFEFDPNRG